MKASVPMQRAAAEVREACRAADDADALLKSVNDVLADCLSYDASTWFATDPATLLATTPARIEGIESGHCLTFWQREFLVDDSLLFRDLQRAASPVASLRRVTNDRPTRSARYREFMEPQGFGDEMRGVLKSGDSTWGVVGCYREKGRPAFDAADEALLASVCTTLADALRTRSTRSTPWTKTPMAPGLLMFDGRDRLMSANTEAAEWLEQIELGALGDLSLDPCARINLSSRRTPGRTEVLLPPCIIALIARARAVAAGYETGPARLRLRSRNGQWLVLHASVLCAPDDAADSLRPHHDKAPVAVVLEPATSSEIAPIIVEAYALSQREREVVRAIARGLSSQEIAGELFLSPHTVRDYVKSVFEKVGVSSRGELVAKLFAEHYTPALHAGAVHLP